ncbi:hypothetical protein NCAS_0B04400 [Naumovozyma castellii]|uniref:RNA polymerase I-specific transcription initiation factor RRN10 n=1 Tax=Naumovozyma castellii TaxID=27288 RepID=G0VAJ8_NAUCA|nr:hypothetical protein NCAS_0B04400 [Naumovozyma castellii CBS 4309]CCC68524.1 hypothetical protein NCAS_0B04400 [Naumovozyma castellii CBS 4309]
MDRNVYEACSDLITEFNTHVISADEVLAEKVDHLVPIPFKTREDLQQAETDGLFSTDLLPNIDLRVLHYFATQLCLQRYPQLINTLEETSLITLGLLVEKWVQDYLTAHQDNEDDGDDDSIGEGPSQAISIVTDYYTNPANI